MSMNEDKVILSEEPQNVRINIQDPAKPKPAGQMIKVPKKVPWYDKLISAMFGPEVNSQNIGEHFVRDWAIPTGQRMLNNGIQSGLKRAGDATQMLIFGKVINNSGGPVDYSSYSNSNAVKPIQGAYRVMDQVDTFAFTELKNAEACLSYLRGRIKAYGSATVVDYFEWINDNLRMNIPLDYNMTDRGWIDLNSATVSQCAAGYIIELPRPIFLKRG